MEGSNNQFTSSITGRRRCELIMGSIDEVLSEEEPKLGEAKLLIEVGEHHDHHLGIMRDMATIALNRMSDPTDKFDYIDYEETLQIIDRAVEDPAFVWNSRG